MAFTFPVPDDPYYDFLPIDPADIEVGMDILFIMTSGGEVTDVNLVSPTWQYTTEVETPWGVPLGGIAVFPEHPETQPADWWRRMAVWTQEAKPAERYTLVSGDGSRWIYPGDSDGKMVCYWPGGSHSRSDRLSRGAITTSADDKYIADDPEWDWMPVVDGSTVVIGDQVKSYYPLTGVVDSILYVEITPGYDMVIFYDASSTSIGFYSQVGDPAFAGVAMEVTFYRRLLKPATWSKYSASDGSRWIFDGTAYFCWGGGRTYFQGSTYHRGEIPALTPLPSDDVVTPPKIREVITTGDDAVGPVTLTTSGSVVAGDVLEIVYAPDADAASSAPTSTAGTLTQVGTDISNGLGDGLCRVFRCPVGTSGSHTVTIPLGDTGTKVMAVVTVLTEDAATDGFAKAASGSSVSTYSTPSVTTTGDADLLTCVAYNPASTTAFDLSASGLTERARVKIASSGAQLVVGTVELSASGASPTYPIGITPASGPATVTVAWMK